jgi:hypothetical protein
MGGCSSRWEDHFKRRDGSNGVVAFVDAVGGGAGFIKVAPKDSKIGVLDTETQNLG